MTKKRRYILACPLLILAIGALTSLLLVHRSDQLLFERPEQKIKKAREKIARALSEKHGLKLLFNANELPATDWVTGLPIILAGTSAGEGMNGTALQFDGRRRAFTELPAKWSDVADEFTLALLVNLESNTEDQEILFSYLGPVGLKLDRGNMSFFAGTRNDPVAAAYPYTGFDKFVRIIVTGNLRTGTIQLYENGILKAELQNATINFPEAQMVLGQSDHRHMDNPMKGMIEETAVWQRILSPEEIEKLSDPGQPLLKMLASKYVSGYRRIVLRRALVDRVLKFVDCFNPTRSPWRFQRYKLEELHLNLSAADKRFFGSAHHLCAKSGRRVDSVARSRRIFFVYQNNTYEGYLRLDGSDSRYPSGGRRSYILEATSPGKVFGSTRIRLMPPESAGWLTPLLETRVAKELGSATVSNGVCRLMINGKLAGFYYYENHEKLGVPPGEDSAIFHANPPKEYWKRAAFEELPQISVDKLNSIYDELLQNYGRLFIHDHISPLNARKINYLLERQRKEIAELPRDEVASQKSKSEILLSNISAFDLLGNNPSPKFIITRLQLPDKLSDGTPITSTSSKTNLMTSTGDLK
ncbi:MAG: hypothetical protein GX811_13860, partial [Lentisphaerae bacterium]|nr:hypothetical protein [Lentisphaerota bacterium]